MRPPEPGLSTAKLLAVALRHYRFELHGRVTRYKQVVTVLVLLALPGLAQFKALILSPLGLAFQAGRDASLAAVAHIVIFTFWAALQRGAVSSVASVSVMNSLPIPRWRLLLRDTALLLLVSTPLIALLIAAASMGDWTSDPFSRGLTALAITTLGTACQLALLRERYFMLTLIIAAMFAARMLPDAAFAWIAISAASVAIIGLCRGTMSTYDYRYSKASRTTLRLPRPATTPVSLYWRALYLGRHGAFRLTLAGLSSAALLLGAFLISQSFSPARMVGLTSVFGALAVGALSFGYATLFAHQRAYAGVLQVLPISRLRGDLDVIAAVQAPAIVLIVALAGIIASEGIEYALLAISCSLVLCALQYLIYRTCPRHVIAVGLLASILLVVLTSTLAFSWSH